MGSGAPVWDVKDLAAHMKRGAVAATFPTTPPRDLSRTRPAVPGSPAMQDRFEKRGPGRPTRPPFSTHAGSGAPVPSRAAPTMAAIATGVMTQNGGNQ